VKRFEGRAAIARIVVVWLITALTLLLLSAVLSNFKVESFGWALLAAALIGILNALVWPIFIRFALPITVLTLGLGALALNGLVIVLVAEVLPGVTVGGIFDGIVVAIGLTLVNTVVTTLLAIDDDEFHYRNVVRRRQLRRSDAVRSDVPGVLFLEIDGLAHAVIQRALRDGNAPTIAGWLREGTHHLMSWETDWSSQTGACQAGLLHGDNDDMPAFRWWEKDRNAPIVTNMPRDATELERRHSNGRGLLHEDGASRANILSGDAKHSMLTMSTVLDTRRGRIGADYYAYFANPYNVTRTILLALADIAQERWFAAQQRRRDIRPRIHRDRKYAIVRAWATVVQRDLQVEAVIADLYAGRPVVYTTFLAYDEVAHHSGVERPDALATLARVDRQIGRIARAAEDGPRPYHLVVLSDHGQSQGTTFLDRYGESLEEVARGAFDGDPQLHVAHEGGDEALGYLSASLTEASHADNAAARTLARATRGRTVDGAVQLSEEVRAEQVVAADDGKVPDLSVMASGNLGLISFPRVPARVTLEWLEAHHPRLVPALRQHPGIGFLLVRSEADGAVVLGPRGINRVDRGEIEGEDPLAPFGPNAARHVKRTDSFPHCPDIVLNSTYCAETDEVAAFEELVGSHGGLGGEQSLPFAVVPDRFAMPDEPIVGAEAMHRLMRRWLVDLGHDAYR